ncbi:MAG: LptF/LptG family permease [Tannerella sp.]|jgi:lipopolysaccharide export system permease protein|nr:LptF/LptG family permease [Tannerella sp.]
MRIVKRLDLFLLKTFLPLFLMTFGICLFIFLMQFLWKYVDEMVGKGIEMYILAELFFYAALTFVPQALPLAILFASLMTFGNLGEQLELLAMKSSGISLMRIMRPLTIFLIFTAISAFFFQNNVIPVSQVKMYTLLYSVRQKSPELEIPESIFTEINGRNIHVRKKDKKKSLLKDVMIYDYSEGFNNIRVIVADSGRLKTSTDKKYLVMTLYNGESFQNMKGNNRSTASAQEAVPYRRETFDAMEMLIEFDGNFNMRGESLFQDRYVGKNIASLQHSIDSMTVRIDSIKEVESKALYMQSYRKSLSRPPVKTQADGSGKAENDSLAVKRNIINFDSLYRAQEPVVKASLLSYSKRSIDNLLMNYGMKSETMRIEEKEIRWHHTEMHRKFTLSFACLVFFFIGAPLGAIIRKGGLGAPAVISVFLFVVYYIVDNIGYKMARDGVWLPWQGMWLSSAVLLPLGVFLTYKAVNDSVLLNAETYIDAVKRFIGKREFRKIEKKELIMEYPDYAALTVRLQQLSDLCREYLSRHKRRLHYFRFWKQGGTDYEAEGIASEIESVVRILENSDQNLVLNKTMDFPIIKSFHLTNRTISLRMGIALAVFFPLGGLVYLTAVYRRKLLRQDIKTTIRVCNEMIEIIKDRNIK